MYAVSISLISFLFFLLLDRDFTFSIERDYFIFRFSLADTCFTYLLAL